MPALTGQPKLVLTARDDNARPENNLANALVNVICGRSSAMTNSVRTQLRLTPRARSDTSDVFSPLVHSSITPYEQNVSRTGK
jgi:hypothetical protein